MTTPTPATPVIDLTASAVPITVSIAGALGSSQIVTGAGVILCVTFRETSGSAAAALTLRDGSDTTGQPLIQGGVNANAFGAVDPAAPGIVFHVGVYCQVVSGALTGTLTYVPLPPPP